LKRFLSFFYLIFLGIQISNCNNQENNNTVNLRIAKTVPAIYQNVQDSNFSMHEDTLFYKHVLYTGFQFSLLDKGDTAFLKSFFNGVEEGNQKRWYPNKQLEEERFYINGKKEGIHQGWWPNHQKRFYFTAYNDEYNGEFKEWTQNGILIKFFHYQNGYEIGSQKLWWANGDVRANYVIKNGRKYGLLGLKNCNNPYDSLTKK
jgi:antitoxin component YwqK of YwqJK toxin-antitoxin module